MPGRFTDFDGTIKYDKQNPAASSVEFTVQAASIDTDNPDRDKHLRSEDFFDVEKYPTLTFASVEAKVVDATTLEVTGDLTLRGVTHRITIPVQLLGTMKTPGGEKAGFETSFTINRKDYGVSWNRVLESGTMLGDDVNIKIDIEAGGVGEQAGNRGRTPGLESLWQGWRPAPPGVNARATSQTKSPLKGAHPPAGRNLSSLGCQPQVGRPPDPQAPKGPADRDVESAGPSGLGIWASPPGVDTPGWINSALRAGRAAGTGLGSHRVFKARCSSAEKGPRISIF